MIDMRDPATTPAETRRIVADGFVFGFPLVLADAVRRTHPVGVNQVLGLPDDGAAIAPGLAGDDPEIVRSSAWADLSNGPVVLTLPDTDDRYYSVTLYDAWGRLAGSLGRRTHERGALRLALVGPDWRGEIPDNLTARRVQTSLVWIVVRLAARSPADRDEALALLRRQSLVPLNNGAGAGQGRSAVVDLPTPTSLEWVYALGPDRFFHRLAKLLGRHRAPIDATRILESLAEIGVAAGGDFKPSTDASTRAAIARGFADGLLRIREINASDFNQIGAWRSLRQGETADSFARTVSRSLGAAGQEDILQLTCETDTEGRPLIGAERYVLRFAANQIPPTHGFWTLTLGSRPKSGDLLLRRYAIGDRDNLSREDDGSLELLVQHAPPPAALADHWLPAPPGQFSLCLHLYWPHAPAVAGAWRPPAPLRIEPDVRARQA